MKKIIIILFLSPFIFFSQSRKTKYNRISLEVNAGFANVIYPLTQDFYNVTFKSPSINLGARIMTNDLFGIKGNFNYNKFSFDNDKYIIKDSNMFDESFFYRTSLEGCVNVSNLLNFSTDKFALLGNAGGGFAILQSDRTIKKEQWMNDGSDIMLTFSAGLSPLYKLNKNTVLTISGSLIANLFQTFSFDTNSTATRQGFDGIVYNFSAGIILYFGKRDEHFDWKIN